MEKCPFLSTVNEKVNCYKECPLYTYELNDEGCPFKKAALSQKISIKDIDLYGYEKENDIEDEDSYVDIYVKNYR